MNFILVAYLLTTVPGKFQTILHIFTDTLHHRVHSFFKV